MRPFAAVWDCIPAEKRANKRLLIATSDGAALYYGDAEGALVENLDYRTTALRDSGFRGITGINPGSMHEVLLIAREIQISWFKDLLRDSNQLSFLGPRDRQNYTRILERVVMSAGGAEGSISVEAGDAKMFAAATAALEELFTLENLLSMGGVLKKRGSLIWRNQTGPMTKDSMLEMSAVASTAVFTSVVVMSVPQEVSGRYVKQLGVEQRLQSMGLESSAAPNSLWIKNPLVNKSLPVDYVLRNAKGTVLYTTYTIHHMHTLHTTYNTASA
jgi:hypothetical protein